MYNQITSEFKIGDKVRNIMYGEYGGETGIVEGFNSAGRVLVRWEYGHRTAASDQYLRLIEGE